MQLNETPVETSDCEKNFRALFAKDTCILSIGCRNHRPWQKVCFASYLATGYFHIASLDNPFKTSDHCTEKRDIMIPPVDVFQMPHTWIIGHPVRHDGGVMWPWVWQHKRAIPIIEEYGFEYVLVVNDDVIFDKPAGIEELKELMGDYDIMPYYSRLKQHGTLAFLVKTKAFRKIWDIIFRDQIAQYKRIGNAESRLFEACEELGIDVPPYKYAEDFRLSPCSDAGLWGNVMGIRHLHCETAHRAWNQLFPLEPRYYDERFTQNYGLIKKFWETKDPEVVKEYWATFRPKKQPPRYSDVVKQKIDKERREQWSRIGKS